jgi:protein-S-isoprenylcysteine O-methyltransferase Ste14
MNSAVRFWILLPWVAVGAVWVVTALRLKPVERGERQRSHAVHTGLQLLAAILLFSDWPSNTLLETRLVPQLPSVVAGGIALTVTGIAIAIAARLYLGSNWSARATIKRAHELICSGPYAIVRHPIYFGLMTGVCGTAIALGELRHMAAVPLVLAAFNIKRTNEERLLIAKFGNTYRSYQHAVRWAIFPFVL